jgi:hypothetical protein
MTCPAAIVGRAGLGMSAALGGRLISVVYAQAADVRHDAL